MSAWSHLPNAAHIDRVLASLKANPKIWEDADKAVSNVPWLSAWYAAWFAARNVARDAARNVARDAAWEAALDAAWNPILALVAYDDAAKYLDLPLDQLKMLYALTEHPAAHLLQPAVLAFAMEKALA